MNDDYILWDNWGGVQVARGSREDMKAKRKEMNSISQATRYEVLAVVTPAK